MADHNPSLIRQVLNQKLAESLTGLPAPGTRRRVHGQVRFPGKVTTITGMRRAGKTTFLHQLRHAIHASGVAVERLPFINFEDERLRQLDGEQLGLVVDEYWRQRLPQACQETVTWCFDEIQVVPGWERFIRRLVDQDHTDVIVTGSSADLLSREIATSLRGRAWNVPLFPFSCIEAMDHSGIALDLAAITEQQRSGLEGAMRRWLKTGGFPEAQGIEPATRAQLLGDYVDVAIFRDVVERHSVSNVAGLRWLVRHLLRSPASLFSVEKFYAALRSQGYAISKDTVHALVGYLEDCFLIRILSMESSSERQRMVNPRKVYPIDTGLISIFDQSGKENIGHALESAVLIELERRRYSVTYVKTKSGFEVDFLARDFEGRTTLVQVCADARDRRTADPELRALAEAGEDYPDAARLLIVLDRDGVPSALPPMIEAVTAVDWFAKAPRA